MARVRSVAHVLRVWIRLCVATALLADGAHAQVSPARPAIVAVRVSGNERTADHVILRAAEVPIGSRSHPELERAIRQRVLNLRLFEEVTILRERRRRGVALVIAVKERWTLFPIPFVGASSTGLRAGLFLLETNLFGLNKKLALGGVYSSQGRSVLGFYQDPGIGGSAWVARARGGYADVVRERYRAGDRIYAYADSRWDGALSGGYQVTPALAAYAGWFVVSARASAHDRFARPPAAGTVHGPALEIEMKSQDFRFYFDEGIATAIRYRHALPALGSEREVIAVSARAHGAVAALSDHAASVAIQYDGVVGDRILDALLLGGRPGTRGFEQMGLWAQEALTITPDYQVPIARPSWGTWTLAAFADVGWVNEGDRRSVFAAPGGGVRLYLKRLALPALGIDVAWNVGDGRVLASAAVGLSP